MPNARPLSVGAFLDESLRSFLTPLEPILEKLLAIDRCRAVFDSARSTATDGPAAIRRMLELLSVECRISPAELERIPRSGSLLVTANHPFGLLPEQSGRMRENRPTSP